MRALRVLAGDSGQATVEAAFGLPVLLLLMMMLIQPGIILYDRMVMQAAAAEGCRLLATASSADAGSTCEDYIRRRLGAVPEQALFHVHGDSCSWKITCLGDSSASEVSVAIENEVSLLPLVDAGAALLGMVNEAGNLVIRVESTMPTQPSWVGGTSVGYTPARWVGAWLG